ncbi:flagellar motor switch protein FliN [Endozoicomonas montiporae]|uniref:Flagellar motor switch protein FliN n=1 Tax=Endozoicomonas montiporae CL-33 TaxID=570277 RepID=A0A142BC78_9GAMM|nr:flagellar motor switch protein FliN [Endozoicomonas montiporae]AMO56354.1 Flagellar motor switch FliN [Endozoicomonas montiporae CL-33]
MSTVTNETEATESVELEEATQLDSKPAGPDLSMILDIPVQLSLEVGSTEQTVEQILALAQGSVIELNRKAGEPLDVKVNGTLIARGEVVESQGKYGIRIIDIAGGNDRLNSLL